MNTGINTAIRWLAALAFVIFAAPSSAEGDQRGSVIDSRQAGAFESTRVVTIAARVARADGSPAPGAVVVTSAGGQAVADERGVAHLEVMLPPDAEALHVTAASTESGSTSTGSVRVAEIIDGHHIDAGTITLAENGDCVPEWVPTFGGQQGVNNTVLALTVFDDGSGPTLYAGGEFTTAGGGTVNFIAKWDGASWSPLGSGLNGSVRALTVFDDGSGSGPALYAGGAFTSAGGILANGIAKWDGAAWSLLGDGLDGGSPSVSALTVFDDGSGSGPALYAGGGFTIAGGAPANSIAKWDGAAWSRLGDGMGGGFRTVLDLTVFDDGSGPALYAGGSFTTAGGVTVNRIAKWDGAAWSPLGSGMSNAVSTLTVFDDGSGGGPALYAGGFFSFAGDAPANYIAKWDGAAWKPLGSGVSDGAFDKRPSVGALTVFDDGAGGGPALYAGGDFNRAGGAPAGNIAKWDGASWSPLGTGMNAPVLALTVFDDGAGGGGGGGGGAALYAGGAFLRSPAGDSYLARWQGCASSAPCPGDTNGDGLVNFADLNTVLSEFGQTGPDLPGDVNGDGAVNFSDLNEVLSSFGNDCR